MGEFHPGIAESWELKQSPAGEWYVEYKIKPGLKFPDGTDVDAEAVKYSWDREQFGLPARTQNKEAYHVYYTSTSFERVECPDKLTLWQFTPEPSPTFLPHPFAGMFVLHHGHIYSPTSTEKYCKETDPPESCVNQVGYGPFTLVSYVPEERIVLEKWEDYPENPLGAGTGPTKAKVDRVIMRCYDDPTTMRMVLETGEIDIAAYGLSRADIMDMMDNPDIEIQIAEGMGSTRALAMNFRPEFAPLNDIRVRRAIAYAFFPEEVLDRCLFGIGKIAHSAVHEEFACSIPVFEEEFRKLSAEERIAKAKELLAEAGYPDGFKTEYWYSGGAGAELDREIAAVIQAQLKKIGIDMEIKTVERGVFRDMLKEGRFPMWLNGWQPDYGDPDTDLYYCMHSTSTYMAGRCGYSNPSADELIKLGKNLYDPTGDPPERREVYDELQRLIIEDMVGVWMYHDSEFRAQRVWVKGYHMWHTKPYMTPFWDASRRYQKTGRQQNHPTKLVTGLIDHYPFFYYLTRGTSENLL